jgi:UDP-2,3-diacylglucosamine pyrophosphatase LpxH
MRADRALIVEKKEALLRKEGERVAQMIQIPFQSILVMSDLHLGPGVEEVTTRWYRTENFFCDRSFRLALRWCRDVRTVFGAPPTGPRLLVLNGDVFDFLRITAVPSAEECVAWAALLNAIGRPTTVEELTTPGPARSERHFGLRTNDYKSVWKLSKIFSGHRQFALALSEWVQTGNVLLFVTGNHDVELYWPLVQTALRHLVEGNEQSVMFAQDHLQIGNVYIEHGHQHESMTAIEGPPYLPREPDQLNLPPGSFVNRYLINPLERSEPFLDNVKPQTDMVAAFIKRHPVRAIGMLAQSGRFLVRAVRARRFLDSAWIIVYLIGIALPVLTGLTVLGFLLSDNIQAKVNALLEALKLKDDKTLMTVLGFLAPYIFGAFREGYVWVRDKITRKLHPIGEDHYARKLARALPTRLDTSSGATDYLAVLGHTHRLDRQVMPLDRYGLRATVTYLNTGTWAPLWPRDRPDLMGRTLHPMLFLDHDGKGYQPTQLEWSDGEGEGVECVILMG